MRWLGRGPVAAGAGMLAVGVVAVVLVSVGGRAPGRPSSNDETAAVEEGRFRDVVLLDGVVTAPPQTPLVLTNPASDFEWAVPAGRAVRRGAVLFVEHAPVAGAPLDGLRATFVAAEERVTSARIAARRSVAIARRAVRHSPGDERAAAKAELNRVLAASAERISSALEQQAQVVAPSSAPSTRTVVHRAPDDGIVRRAGGVGEAQGVVGSLQGKEYSIRSPLDPLLLYRFRGTPRRATVTIPGGPPAFRCPDVDVHFGSDQSVELPAESSAPPTPAEPGATLTCSVPGGVRVFPGLRAVVRLTAATFHRALMIPARAVRPEGDSRGTVMLSRGGGWVRRAVVLGPSNGATVVVERGLSAGQTVLLDATSRSPST